MICKNHCVLIKRVHVFLGQHDYNIVCKRCLSSYSIQNVLTKQKQRYEEQEVTAIKTRNESHLFWKKHFHENPLCFKIYADFEADKTINASFAETSLFEQNSDIGNAGSLSQAPSVDRTTNIFEQNPFFNG